MESFRVEITCVVITLLVMTEQRFQVVIPLLLLPTVTFAILRAETLW